MKRREARQSIVKSSLIKTVVRLINCGKGVDEVIDRNTTTVSYSDAKAISETLNLNFCLIASKFRNRN